MELAIITEFKIIYPNMAAPDAKPSPSSKDVQSSEAETTAAPKEALADEMAQAIESAHKPIITAPSTMPTYESSQTSEQYVLAKSLLGIGNFEQALELIEAAIEEHKAVLTSREVGSVDLHECMAPWHYLYGTTLLYQIEESSDTQMTLGDAADEGNADADADPSAAVEDMEIAWENLDTARTITESLLTTTEPGSERHARFELDLAQILLREADLQRWNGRYADAIPDYVHCLELRKRHLPPLDRQLADVQYNIGLSHLSRSTELQTHQEQLTPDVLQQAQEHCQQGIAWYLECARTLCGQIAHSCGVEESVVFKTTTGTSTAGLKTTGLDSAKLAAAEASATLQAWQQNVACLETKECSHLVELLDEVQETVRESEESQRAVRQAAQMKWNAQKEVVQADDGSTTQIGFGEEVSSIRTSVPTTTPVAQQMMVKKKHKRTIEGAENNEKLDSKRAKTEG
jgi:tetratricopeptide (TPR) repeat protein